MTEAVDQNKTKVTFAYNASLPPSYKNNNAFLDSGTTGNYLTVDSPVTNLKLTPNGIQAKIPDGIILQATHQCELRLLQSFLSLYRQASWNAEGKLTGNRKNPVVAGTLSEM
jgi:hypothetical protein